MRINKNVRVYLPLCLCSLSVLLSGCDNTPSQYLNRFSMYRNEKHFPDEEPSETESPAEAMSETETETEEYAAALSLLPVEDYPGREDSVSANTLSASSAEINAEEALQKQQAYLRVCRQAFGKEYTFAFRPAADPFSVRKAQIDEDRSYADSIHFRDLLEINRVPGVRFPRPVRTAQLLQHKLESMIDSAEGLWSVYEKDLFSGEEVIVHDRGMKSASVMKLFVMAAVYQAIADGELEKTSEITARISSMISVSSNEDANYLLSLLGHGEYAAGIDKVNQYMYDHGYSRRSHEFNGFQNEATIMDSSHTNRITARDCARLLESVYHREFGSWAVCSEIEKNMLNQQTRYKIPAGISRVSDSTLSGNKTGEMNHVENDVAIVYSPACDYILCVFSSDWENKDAALKRIQDISEEVWRYHNDSSWLKHTANIPEILIDDAL